MAYSNTKLAVIKGEFGNRDLGRLVPINPMKVPPQQNAAIHAPPKRVMRVPTSIYIDPDFQRNVTDRGKRLISEMVAEWNWAAAEVPRIYYDEARGVEACFDGQHTLIAAATRNDILELACDLHEDILTAPVAAGAFNIRNTKRIPVTTFTLYKSALLAGHGWALKLDALSKRMNFHVASYAGDHGTSTDWVHSISTMKYMLEKRGEQTLETIMKILVGNAIAPIREIHIRAVESLLFDKEYSKLVSQKNLRGVVRGINNNIAVSDAIAEAAKRGMPRHIALANFYLREYQGVHGVR